MLWSMNAVIARLFVGSATRCVTAPPFCVARDWLQGRPGSNQRAFVFSMAPKGVKRKPAQISGECSLSKHSCSGDSFAGAVAAEAGNAGLHGALSATAGAAAGAAAATVTVKRAKTASKNGIPSELPVDVGVSDAGVVDSLTNSLTDPGWREALNSQFAEPYFVDIARFVAEERGKHTVHPPADLVFSAFNVTPLDKVKVVILGQDPYHEPNQAHGMCFSVLPGVTPPPSLKNMYKELEQDISGFKIPDHGHLVNWAEQGVLLLNATLTVREGHKEANSHSKCGWQKFTDEVIRTLNDRADSVVFLLWGGFAQKKGKIVDTSRHRVIECAHPSPLSVKKWRGCQTFSKCNAMLRELGRTEIDWSL